MARTRTRTRTRTRRNEMGCRGWLRGAATAHPMLLLMATAVLLSTQHQGVEAARDKFTEPPSQRPSQLPSSTPSSAPSRSAPPSMVPSLKPVFPKLIVPSAMPSDTPVSDAPVTAAPVTAAPVTAAPVTLAPVTPAPVTPAPVTPAPVTSAPVTSAPVTASPTTPAPITSAPVTSAPVTPAPVTASPVTVAPTVSSSPSLSPVTPSPIIFTPGTQAPISPPSSPAPFSANPTSSSLSPSVFPSSAPSAVSIVGVPLPNITFVTNVTSGVVNTTQVAVDVETFINNTLTENARILGDFQSLNVTVMVVSAVSASPPAARWRMLQTPSQQQSPQNIWDIDLTGQANYRKTYPSEENLERVLNTYFSIWGDDDLADYLRLQGTDVSNVQVKFNGVVLEELPTAATDPPAGAEGNVTNPSSSTSPGLIAGLVVGCVALVAALLLIAWQRRRYQKQQAYLGGSDDSDDADLNRTAPLGMADRNAGNIPAPGQVRGIGGGPGEDMSFSALSLEESLYTTNTEDAFQPNRQTPDQYDATRLDKVISNAHMFLASHDDDGNSNKNKNNPKSGTIGAGSALDGVEGIEGVDISDMDDGIGASGHGGAPSIGFSSLAPSSYDGKPVSV